MSYQKIGNVFHIKHRQQVFVIIKREKELAGVLRCERDRVIRLSGRLASTTNHRTLGVTRAT